MGRHEDNIIKNNKKKKNCYTERHATSQNGRDQREKERRTKIICLQGICFHRTFRDAQRVVTTGHKVVKCDEQIGVTLGSTQQVLL